MFVFVFKHNDQDCIAVVIAPNPAKAYELLAKAKQPDEDEPDLDHVKRYWDVEYSTPADVPAAIVEATIDMSEGYNIFAKGE